MIWHNVLDLHMEYIKQILNIKNQLKNILIFKFNNLYTHIELRDDNELNAMMYDHDSLIESTKKIFYDIIYEFYEYKLKGNKND